MFVELARSESQVLSNLGNQDTNAESFSRVGIEARQQSCTDAAAKEQGRGARKDLLRHNSGSALEQQDERKHHRHHKHHRRSSKQHENEVQFKTCGAETKHRRGRRPTAETLCDDCEEFESAKSKIESWLAHGSVAGRSQQRFVQF
mmetsp:Transcript_14483/g.28924  ORF Transcript_14483/g.28924 Transcript_14483/m.28924 type:complete len:146 (+) Transcript_14483:455-892(+)